MSETLLGEAKFELNALSFKPKSALTSGFVKILANGELNAQGADRRLLITVNNQNSGYRGFVMMNGDASAGEWEQAPGGGPGFYVGRNGWSIDATAMVEFTLAISPTSQKITGSGLSTFALGDGRILGYQSHGYLVTNQPISSIEVAFVGGVAVGYSRFYLL
ncbi:hypothetical protein [Mesorhizobium comanense]|uniref:hypothetical protein n=1 Tax=Mesorhizobium comanense TaxID=2502215 RepID=UPI0010F7D5A1|nr:hypothetical protein [Mesorhizobium comanense]